MKKGFTLIELLVVISIISLLSSIVLVALNDSREEAREAKYITESLDTITGLNICGYFGRDDEGCTASESTCSELGWGINRVSYNHDLSYESCGESDLPNCYSGFTWKEAKDICENLGARLCTIEELENEVSGGTGCGWDARMIWSMSPCNRGMYISEGNYGLYSDGNRVCQQDLNNIYPEGGYFTSNPIAVRCCADY